MENAFKFDSLDSGDDFSIASDMLRLDPDFQADEMFCESCKKDQKHSAATAFCIDCVEYYCDVCLKFHNRFARTHNTLDEQSMPRNFCVEICESHDSEIIKFLCLECDKVACAICKENNHSQCNSLKHIPVFVTSETFLDKSQAFMKTLNNLDDCLGNAVQTTLSNLTDIQSFCDNAKAFVKRYRHEVNTMLDRLEREMENIIESKRKNDQSAMASLKAKYEALASVLNPIHASVEMSQNSGQLCKTLVTIQKEKQNVDDIQNKMVGLIEESKAIYRATGAFEFVPEATILKLECLGKLIYIADKSVAGTETSTSTDGKNNTNIEKDVQDIPSRKLAVAVFGDSGSGKSAFIKSLLELDESDVTDKCCANASIEKLSYCSDKYPHLVVYEFPGIVTSNENETCEHDRLDIYDIVIIISRGRFNENHIRLADDINHSCSETKATKMYFVRTHLGEDIDNDKHAHPKTHSPQKVICQIRQDCEKKLVSYKQSPVYLIDSIETTKYDFPVLVDAFCQYITDISPDCITKLK